MNDSAERMVLAIAGSDPSGGAGVQADITTIADCGAQPIFAITALTAQTDEVVLAIHPTPADLLTQQLSTACRGREPDAIKIGMVATAANIKAIAWFLRCTKCPQVVIDPILHSSSGVPLLEQKAVAIYRQQLLPLATVITPNLPEASNFAGMQIANAAAMQKAAEIIYHETIRFRAHPDRPLAIVIKGGHLPGAAAIDLLFDGKRVETFSAPRIPGPSPRGTGCRFSSAIAVFLAQGDELSRAVSRAKSYLSQYISAS